MRDVAALAGVSVKTVSRVVNGEAGVTPGLIESVRRAADQLDFRPHLGARTLRRGDGKTATVGLLLENVSNPFSGVVHRAVEDVARRRGVAVFASSLEEDPAREREVAAAFTARRVDGLIVVPAGQDHTYLLNELRAGLSVVFVDRAPVALDVDAVVSNNRDAAAEAVSHLIRRGHRRIAFLGDVSTIVTTAQRRDGYLDAHIATNIPVYRELIATGLGSTEVAEHAAVHMLDLADPPTAIFGGQNLVTIGAIRALRRRALQHRVALVGFDDFLLADLLEPAVTVMAQHPVRMGELAASRLFRRLDGDSSPARTHVVPATLVERGSGEILPPRR